jgi:FkbM family methyltransferase
MNLTLEQYEQLNPCCAVEHAGTRMVFATPNLATKWRVESIYRKEPWTLEWIETFQPQEILIDVGANVGMYSIWAAATRQAKVFAFEPESQNFALLNRNIFLNKLQSQVTAYCAGLSDRQGLVQLYMGEMFPGGSCHSVGEAIDYKNEPLKAVFEQGCIAFKLDDLVSQKSIPVPNHIKIDVDGLEPKVIAGARTTLKDPSVTSLLVETNLNLVEHQSMVRELNDLGFHHDPGQVQRAVRKEGPFKGVAEHVFKR